MQKCILFIIVLLAQAHANTLHAQTAKQIIATIAVINDSLTLLPAEGANVISNKALSIFLSNKIGTYLSDYNDLSLYKNYITFNSAEGTFTVNHNKKQPTSADRPIRSFFIMGGKANILNAFSAAFNRRQTVNNIGITARQVWMGKSRTTLITAGYKGLQQKEYIDAARALIVQQLAHRINYDDSLFSSDVSRLKVVETQKNFGEPATSLQKDFNKKQLQYYSYQFANEQAQLLIETNSYKTISTSWTSLGVFIPLLNERYKIAASVSTPFAAHRNYPFAVTLTHTRFRESATAGRTFLKFNGTLYNNNSFQSKFLQTLSLAEYSLAGGVDAASVRHANLGEVIIGNYKNFITPQLSVLFAYIPAGWHFGVSLSAEQNFGSYKATNCKIGLPVVLIDNTSAPSITFEFQIKFFDVAHKVQPLVAIADKTSVGFTVGVPFSKIVY